MATLADHPVPGLTRTPMVGEVDDTAVCEGPLANLLERVSVSDDVATTVAFLCSPFARQITAQVIHCSAGNVA